MKTLEAAAPHAGLLAAAFMAGRFGTAHFGGRIADARGRRLALQTSVVGSIVGSVFFGLSSGHVWPLPKLSQPHLILGRIS